MLRAKVVGILANYQSWEYIQMILCIYITTHYKVYILTFIDASNMEQHKDTNWFK